MLLSFLQFVQVNESRSPEVELIQADLKALGEPWAGLLGKAGPNGDGVDGELGPKTRAALERFLKEADPKLRVGNLADAKIRALGIGQPAKAPGSATPAGKGSKVLLVHGLTSARSAETQRALLAQGLGVTPDSVGLFGYKGELDSLGLEIKASQGSTVVLYSAGCSNAAKVASLMKSSGADLRKLWCLEPYAKAPGTVKVINAAISQGMPEQNVVTGPAVERGGGKGVWAGAQQTPAGKDHFGALTELGKLIAGR